MTEVKQHKISHHCLYLDSSFVNGYKCSKNKVLRVMNMELPFNLLGFVQVYTGIMIYDRSIICKHNGVPLDIVTMVYLLTPTSTHHKMYA